VATFLSNVSPRLQTGAVSELDGVREGANAVRAFGVVPGAMDVLLREHFAGAVRRLGLLDIGEGGATAVTVAFIDLVESTQLTRDVTPSNLTAALSDFENMAMDSALNHDCRVVKLIGDEVMVVGAAPVSLLAVVDDVLSMVEHHTVLGAARAGVAAGYAIPRDGDYFGPAVNLAARLVGAASPGEVLVDQAVATAAMEHELAIESAGEYALKGFDEPVAASRFRR
jgi:class 3 adenylate cyclase